MTDIVLVSLESWDRVWRRNQHLVAGLLDGDPQLRVLFVEPSPDPLHRLTRGQVPHTGHGPKLVDLQGAEGRLWTHQPTKWLPRRFSSRVDDQLAESVIRTASHLGFTSPILWVNDPGGAVVLRKTGWPAVYDITDDWLEADRPAAAHDRLTQNESFLMKECEEVVVCSLTLYAKKGLIRPVTLVQNAVEVSEYRRPRPKPEDLPEGPVALYVGTLHRDRLDINLCVETARALSSNGTLVLVGPVLLSGADREVLQSAGVRLLGPKRKEEVPGYLQHADVLLVPHVVTPFTLSLDPIKRYEYAAVGRPVISTPVTGFVEGEIANVTVAGAEDFPRVTRNSLPAPYRFPVRADAYVPSWADRVAEMAIVLGRLQRPSRPA